MHDECDAAGAHLTLLSGKEERNDVIIQNYEILHVLSVVRGAALRRPPGGRGPLCPRFQKNRLPEPEGGTEEAHPETRLPEPQGGSERTHLNPKESRKPQTSHVQGRRAGKNITVAL